MMTMRIMMMTLMMMMMMTRRGGSTAQHCRGAEWGIGAHGRGLLSCQHCRPSGHVMPDACLAACCGGWAQGAFVGAAAVASFCAAVLTEIYLPRKRLFLPRNIEAQRPRPGGQPPQLGAEEPISMVSCARSPAGDAHFSDGAGLAYQLTLAGR
jgi:hypothetical protein